MLTETSALTVDARRRRPRKVSAVGVMVHAIGISGGSGALVLAVLLVGVDMKGRCSCLRMFTFEGAN